MKYKLEVLYKWLEQQEDDVAAHILDFMKKIGKRNVHLNKLLGECYTENKKLKERETKNV